MIASGFPLSSGNTFRVIGIRMPKVPQEVPVAKDRPTAIRKMIAGRKPSMFPALFSTMPATYSAAPRESVIAFRVQARERIMMAGTIALKPSDRQLMHSLKLRTLRST